MPPKRKSEVIDVSDEDAPAGPSTSKAGASKESAGPAKRARTSKAKAKAKAKADAGGEGEGGADAGGEGEGGEGEDAPGETEKKTDWHQWQDIVLPGEEDGEVPIYDDCNEVRRKIAALQRTPGFKVTPWLKHIGNINNNSYQRFVKAKGPNGGASNGTYYAAYVYFEKVRIADGKKKTPTRQRHELEHPSGFDRKERKHVWVKA